MSTTGLFKPLCNQGHIRTKDSISSNGTCKECTREEARSEQGKARNRKYGKIRRADKKYRDATRVYTLKKFGLTPESYEELLAQQDYKCAICRQPQSELKRRLAVDHDHITGKVRGLLCTVCNAIIVSVAENYSELLERAKEYLKRGF